MHQHRSLELKALNWNESPLTKLKGKIAPLYMPQGGGSFKKAIKPKASD
jgi:hypothetical protein